MKKLHSLIEHYNNIENFNIKESDRLIREMIEVLYNEHYKRIHEKKNEFIPGESYITHAGKVYDQNEMIALANATADFWLTSGEYANIFEKEFAKFIGVKHCALTNSGSSANLLAVSALTSSRLGERRLKPGDEVITVAAGFPTTVNPIIQNNLVPVFCDIDLMDCNINAEQLINSITKKTKAIMLAHSLGAPFNLEVVMMLKEKYGLWVIEDNCDAVGSKWNNEHTGTFGDIATTSFYPAHHITMGEGGSLLTNNSKLKKIIESFRDWGRDCWCDPGHDNTCGKRFDWQLGGLPYGYDHKFTYGHAGYNLKITDMQAAIGVEQLKKLPDFISKRKSNWRMINDFMKRYEDYFYLPNCHDDADPSWFGFALILKENAPFKRNDITSYLETKKIRTRLLFSGNIIRQPYFKNIEYRSVGDLKNTDYVMDNLFWIGCYPGINNDMINYIENTIDEFIKEYV